VPDRCLCSYYLFVRSFIPLSIYLLVQSAAAAAAVCLIYVLHLAAFSLHRLVCMLVDVHVI